MGSFQLCSCLVGHCLPPPPFWEGRGRCSSLGDPRIQRVKHKKNCCCVFIIRTVSLINSSWLLSLLNGSNLYSMSKSRLGIWVLTIKQRGAEFEGMMKRTMIHLKKNSQPVQNVQGTQACECREAWLHSDSGKCYLDL